MKNELINTNVGKPLLLDIMLDGRYKCQVKYTKHGFPTIIEGRVVELFNINELKAYVEETRPSLAGKHFNILFSDQKI